MKRLHPTILLAPPIFYEMTHGDLIKGSVYRHRVRDALAGAVSLLPSSALRRYISRRLYRNLYQQFGQNIRLLITGMAPIRREIAHFFARAQLPLCEAYGMVEAGVMAFRPPSCKEFGSVGRPLRDVHFTIGRENELIVSRPSPLTLRYFQSADGENARTFLSHNKIATGDIGRIDKAGNLFVLGRKGETIVTPSGQKVHPEVIEREINKCPHVGSSVIFQRANTGHLSCVISLSVPGNEDLKRSVQKHVSSLQSTKRISPFVEVIFADAPFSRENGMLRPNMKIDRRNVIAYWSKDSRLSSPNSAQAFCSD
jgi:long-subunit acyl-CoA synthetase (AMP-forming)